MKKFDRLAFYGWPALAVIILFALFAGVLLLPGREKAPDRPMPKAASVRYAVTDNREPLSPAEKAEVRALYASDLFASSRESRFPALNAAVNRLDQTNITPSVTPLFYSFPPSANPVYARLSAINVLGADNAVDDLPLSVHPPRQSRQKTPKLCVEIKGALKQGVLEPDIFNGKAFPLPADRKPRSFQAQIRVNNEGRVEHVFAESADRDEPVYADIISRLYQCRFSGITQACEGTIIIGYPAYSADPGK